ncbi:MAG TPA: A/G-specific adenine glycosylase [Myxococcaceae bacterium]|nr:A/G-specific adenine glycosylase [Myxococcaceae bacterium]
MARARPPSPVPLDAASLAPARAALLAWFDRDKRDLPWRRTRDPYAIWLSEVMLQQTQVSTVIPYWTRFLERFPTVRALAEAPLGDVLALWRGLGYYARARNLHRAAQEVVSRFGGALPATVEELSSLPGFGRYTAGAVASIAFGQPAPLVDGNVARVLSRLCEVDGPPGDRERERTLWQLAEALAPGERPGDLNQSLMELGALLCKPEAPTCLLCPVREHCRALRAGRVAELPPPKVRAARKHLRLAVAVWERREKRVLLGRREEKGLFGGLWELPSVEVPAAIAVEELPAVLGAHLEGRARVGEHLGTVKRTLTHRDLELLLFRVEGATAPKALPGYRELRWASAEEAAQLGMSTAMQHALKRALPAPKG